MVAGRPLVVVMPETPDTEPTVGARARRAGGGRRRIAKRVAATLALVGGGALLIIANPGFRTFEATLGGWLTGLVTQTRTLTVGVTHSFYWSVGTPAIRGLTITGECSAAFIAGPLLVLAGLFAAAGRLHLGRVTAAGLLAAGVAVLTNLARLGMIGFATYTWGPHVGFEWSHVVFGSLLTVAGTLVALVLFGKVALGTRRPQVVAPGQAGVRGQAGNPPDQEAP